MAALVLGLWSHLFGSGITGKAFPLLFISGCVGFGLGDLAMFQAFPRIGTRRTMVLVQCLAAPFATVIEWLWLGHLPSAPEALSGAVILAGVALALMPGRDEAQPSQGLRAGIVFGAIAALGQAGGAVLSRAAYAVAVSAGETFQGVGDGVNAAYQRLLGGILVSALFFAFHLELQWRPGPGQSELAHRGVASSPTPSSTFQHGPPRWTCAARADDGDAHVVLAAATT